MRQEGAKQSEYYGQQLNFNQLSHSHPSSSNHKQQQVQEYSVSSSQRDQLVPLQLSQVSFTEYEYESNSIHDSQLRYSQTGGVECSNMIVLEQMIEESYDEQGSEEGEEEENEPYDEYEMYEQNEQQFSSEQVSDSNSPSQYEGVVTWMEQQINYGDNLEMVEEQRNKQGVIQQTQENELFDAKKQENKKTNRVYPKFPTFKSRVRDSEGIYRQIRQVVNIREDKPNPNVKVRLIAQQKLFRWVNRKKVPECLIRYYYEDKEQIRRQNLPITIIGTYVLNYPDSEKIKSIIKHFFHNKELYFKCEIAGEKTKIFKRHQVHVNNPQALAQYYMALDERLYNHRVSTDGESGSEEYGSEVQFV